MVTEIPNPSSLLPNAKCPTTNAHSRRTPLTTHLFTPLKIRDVEFRNRIAVSPMCQYSSTDGFANDWHLVHLGSRAVGGAGLVFTEAAAVQDVRSDRPQDLGSAGTITSEMLARITDFVRGHGAAAGIQLAHAGRKAATARPWEGGKPLPVGQGGWQPVGPSAVPFDAGYQTPEELSPGEIREIAKYFGASAGRALQAGFQGDRNSRGARVSAARVLLPDEQPAHRRLWRQL